MTDAKAQAVELLRVLDRLIQVLRQEIAMLHRMDPSAMQTLQHDKIILTAAYESLLAGLNKEPSALRSLPDELRQRIMHVTSDFQTTLTDNARALFAVKEANERLFKAIIAAVEEQRSESTTYSASGVLAKKASARGGSAAALAYDNRL